MFAEISLLRFQWLKINRELEQTDNRFCGHLNIQYVNGEHVNLRLISLRNLFIQHVFGIGTHNKLRRFIDMSYLMQL